MTSATALGGIGEALGHRDYRLYSIGAAANYLGTWIYRTGLNWYTWELTQSPAWLGIVVFAEVLPIICLVPVTGALVDRIGALRVAKRAQIVSAAVMGALAALTIAGMMTIEILLVLVALNGATMSLMQASYFSLVASLVPREHLSSAVALQSSLVQTARFVGPAVAGLILVFVGAGLAFAVNAVSYFVFLGLLLMIAYRDPKRRPEASLFGEIVQGVAYVAGHPTIRVLLLVTVLVAILLRPVVELLPAFAAEVFDRGADGLAWFLSIAGLGAIFGSLAVARRGRVEGLTWLLALTTVLAGGALLVFAGTGLFWLAVLLMAVYGLATNVSSICSQILIQNVVDPSLRARVMSLVGLTFRAVPAAAAAVLGALAEIWGLGLPVTIAALLGILVGLWAIRQIRVAGLDRRAEDAPAGAPR